MKMTNGVLAKSIVGLLKAEAMFNSESDFAKNIGASRQRLSRWKIDILIPHEFAERICIATKGKITMYELRPDCKNEDSGMKEMYFRQFLETLQNNKNLFL